MMSQNFKILEKVFFENINKIGLEMPIKEYKFHPVRKWRFDYLIKSLNLAIEVEGGVWVQGRHTRGSGFVKDMEKYNTATIMGYKIIRVLPNELISNKLLKMIMEIKSHYKNSGL